MVKYLKTWLVQTNPDARRYGLMAFIGLIAGVVSAFVKWGGEVPLPPRSPTDFFTSACKLGDLAHCSRDFLNPPYLFLRDWLHVADPNAVVYMFAGHAINWVTVTHVTFSIIFGIGYCVVAEIFPKVKLWQGVWAGIVATICVHWISFPLMHLTPPLSQLPWYEYVSELFGHIVWFWSIEVIRRDLRNRITHEPDADVSLDSPFR
ncbi:YagU family protein [Pseudescherichia vulneris]